MKVLVITTDPEVILSAGLLRKKLQEFGAVVIKRPDVDLNEVAVTLFDEDKAYAEEGADGQ